MFKLNLNLGFSLFTALHYTAASSGCSLCTISLLISFLMPRATIRQTRLLSKDTKKNKRIEKYIKLIYHFKLVSCYKVFCGDKYGGIFL